MYWEKNKQRKEYSKLPLYMEWLPLRPTTQLYTMSKGETWKAKYKTLFKVLIDSMVFDNAYDTGGRLHAGHVLLVDKASVHR